MEGPEGLAPLSSAILDLEDWLARARPRTTNDVDGIVLVPDDGFADFLANAARSGFPARHPNAASFARSSRMFLLRHARSGVNVDLSAGCLGFEKEIVGRARKVAAFGRRLPVPRPADLVILQAIASRPQDYADIANVLDQNPRLDRQRVRLLVSLFAEVLEAPERLAGVESLLRRRKGVRS